MTYGCAPVFPVDPMNKKELTTVVVLILMMFVWMIVDSTFINPMFPEPPEPEATPETAQETPADSAGNTAADGGGTPTGPDPVAIATPEGGTQTPALPTPAVEEKVHTLLIDVSEDSKVELSFSNLGAALKKAVLLGYPETIEAKDDPSTDPVILDFSASPALVYARGALTDQTPFVVTEREEGGLQFTTTLANGLQLERTVKHREGYELEITDRVLNSGSESVPLPGMDLLLGRMLPRENISQRFGPYIGVDAQHTGEQIKHYVKEMRKGLKKTDTFTQVIPEGLEWFGVKNKFFTQVLTNESSDWPEPDSLWMEATESEGEAMIGSARAALRMDGTQLNPGQSVSRTFGYYLGPISMQNLGELGEGQQDVIDYRLWRIFLPITAVMMQGLNGLYSVVNNWGLAIILLTLVVRMLIWPLSLKGTENMKKMSELSPQIKELREKHKNNPQKLNAEMSKLYRENKVNPMAGCLPMFIQMPIFISLYGVLRVHVGLRYESFLWIQDLSEQEAIFTLAGITLNILPLTMTASMMYLQRMTPSNMDPQQQKIMMFMPIMFLFICYNMPAGLLLYMNTSNLVSISQTFYTKKRDEKRKAAQAGTTSSGSSSGKKGKK